MKQYILRFAILGLIVESSLGNSPLFDYPYVETGFRSENFFVMIPDKVMPFGKCYRIDDNGDPKLLWTVKGWYSHPKETTLSSTGKYLVRFLLPNPIDITPSEIEVKPYLEIYADGILVKSLLVGDLVDPKNLPTRLPKIADLLQTDIFTGSRAEFSNVFLMKVDNRLKPYIPKDLDESTEVFFFGITDAERVVIILKNGKVIAHIRN